MTNVLFYNADRGAGAVGVVDGASFRTTEDDEAGSFAPGWTHIDGLGALLFYNDATGAAAIGEARAGQFATTQSFRPGFFATGWTHVVPAGFYTLFYRAPTGEGAIVELKPSPRTTKLFPAGSFSAGWTHITRCPSDISLLLFYNADTGSAAISEQFDNRKSSGNHFADPNDLRTTKSFGAGSFSTGWSHIIDAGGGRLLFYNSATGAGAVSTMTKSDFTTVQSFADGSFKTGWTNIVSAGGTILFYDASDGSAAIGFNPTVKLFPAGSFGTWTHLAGAVDLVPPH